MDIAALPATELLARLERRELTSVDIVTALSERRAGVDPRVNAFVHVRHEALDEARAADEARDAGNSLGPLHGLPITIKDNVDIAGLDSTMGTRARLGKPATRDAVLVQAVRDAGAIILGKTNIPQLLLAQETENALFGVTKNPWNPQRVPGGSSGGEAAAVAAGMTPLGIGTDIGGSIRIPSHFCGVAGLKPTLDRWSNRGSTTAIPGQELVRSQIGPIARTVDDLILMWRALDPRHQAALDPQVPPLAPGDPDSVDLSGLTIGYTDEDPFLQPVGSLRRAVARAREVLEAAGARLVRYQPTPSEDIVYLWLAALGADGGRTLKAVLDGEDFSPQLKPSQLMLRLPPVGRRALSKLLLGLGETRVGRLVGVIGEKSVDELWKLTAKRTELRRREFDGWRAHKLDALLCPPHVVPALGHRQSGDFVLSVAAEFRWTLLNFPAGVVPVTTVAQGDVGGYQAAGSDRVEKKVAAIDAASVGLPVGVQIVARPYGEDVALAVMRAISRGVADDTGCPVTPVMPR